MRVPKYKREPIKAADNTERTTGMVEAAQAKGYAGIAGEQARLASQHGRRASMEVASFTQRLAEFSARLDGYMGVHAKKKAIDNASSQIMSRRDKILQIKLDPNLTDEEKVKKAAEESIDLSNDVFSVYGRAYDTTAKSGYVDQIVVEAKEAAQIAAQSAQGDPEIFKESFKTYADKFISSAPDKSTGVAVARILDTTGVAMYKTLYNDKYSDNRKEGKEISELAANDIRTLYTTAVERGNDPAAIEARAAFTANRQAAVNSGYVSPAKAQSEIKALDILAEMGAVKTAFREADDKISVYEELSQAYNDGRTDHWGQGKASKMLTSFEAQLDAEADLIYEDAMTILKDGNSLTDELQAKIDRYTPFMPEAKIIKLSDAKATQAILSALRGEKPSEQIIAIQNEKEKRKDDPRWVEALNAAELHIKRNMNSAKSDPILLGVEEGRYEITPLSPEKITPEQVKSRKLSKRIAQKAYGSTAFFTAREAEEFASYVNSKGVPIKEKYRLITMIDDDDAFNQLSKKGASVFAGAASLKNRPTIAMTVLRGQQYFQEGVVTTNRLDLRATTAAEFGDFFKYTAKGDGEKILKTVESYAGALAVDAGLKSDGEVDMDHIEEAVEAIMGKHGKYNDHTFFAPPGVDPDDVIDFFDDLPEAGLPPMQGIPQGKEAEAIQRSEPILHPNGKGYIFMLKGVPIRNISGDLYQLEYKK